MTLSALHFVAANDPSGTAAAVAGGGLLLIGGLTILGIVLTVVWLFFPFVLFGKLNKISYALDTLNHNIRIMAKEAELRASATAVPPRVPNQDH